MGMEWLQHVPWHRYGQACACEFVGCFFINFLGCGAAVATGCYGYNRPSDFNASAVAEEDAFFLDGEDFHVVVSLAFGLVISANMAMFQHKSGAHFNPSITIGMLAIKKVNLVRGLLYLPVQFLGGLAGSFLLKVVIPPLAGDRDDVFPPTVGQNGLWQSCVWEFFLSFMRVLMFLVICREAVKTLAKATGPLMVGVAVILTHMASVYVSGGCSNPARALGSMVASNQYDHIWVFLVLSPLGGVLGAVVHYFFFMEMKRDHTDEEFLPRPSLAPR